MLCEWFVTSLRLCSVTVLGVIWVLAVYRRFARQSRMKPALSGYKIRRHFGCYFQGS